MKVRGKFIVDGVVQGVGYRDAVRAKARMLKLTGFVQNMKDGTVEIVCEGEERSVRAFLKKIRINDGWVEVDEIGTEFSEPTGEFRFFKIRIGPQVSDGDLEIMERLDRGRREMQLMNASLSGKQDDTLNGIRTMDGHMSGHFGHLNKKYGEFGKTMKGMAGNMKGMASDIKVIRKEATRGEKKTPVHGAKKTVRRRPARHNQKAKKG